jgi:hypothetical protein
MVREAQTDKKEDKIQTKGWRFGCVESARLITGYSKKFCWKVSTNGYLVVSLRWDNLMWWRDREKIAPRATGKVLLDDQRNGGDERGDDRDVQLAYFLTEIDEADLRRRIWATWRNWGRSWPIRHLTVHGRVWRLPMNLLLLRNP